MNTFTAAKYTQNQEQFPNVIQHSTTGRVFFLRRRVGPRRNGADSTPDQVTWQQALLPRRTTITPRASLCCRWLNRQQNTRRSKSETCTGTNFIIPIPIYPRDFVYTPPSHPVSLPFPPIPVELRPYKSPQKISFHLHPFRQRRLFINENFQLNRSCCSNLCCGGNLSTRHWIKVFASEEVDDGFTCCWWYITKVKYR